MLAQNTAYVWPVQIGLNVIALTCVGLIFRPGLGASRAISALLVICWWWLSFAYQFVFTSATRPAAAWLLGGGAFVGGLGFLCFGVLTCKLQFHPVRGWRRFVGGALIGYALLIYPVLGHLAGHRSPYEPTLGVPPATTMFTLGLLLFASRPMPRLVLVIPILWTLVGSFTALMLRVPEDLALLVAGGAAIVAAVSAHRPDRLLEHGRGR